MNGKHKLMIIIALIVGIAIGMILMGIVFSNPGSTNKGIEVVQNEQSGHTEKSGGEHGGEIARLSDEELQEFGIEIATAAPGKLQIHTDLTGEIVIDLDRLAHMVPRFPGVVKEVRKKIGDKVGKGEVIAIIESNESLAPYEVTSLIGGIVIEMHMTQGEVIEDAGHAVVVADLSDVWANLSVYQKDLPYVRVGQAVLISAGPGVPETSGTVSYVSPIVDEKTRTAIARVILPNSGGRWKPGLFVTGRLTVQEVNVGVAVPKTAIETMENRPVVFIQTDDGFKPQTVVLGRSNETHVEITGGLQPGQRYVAQNGFVIKAELAKSAFGEGHGH